MTAVKQRAMRIINAMPEAEVEKFVSVNFRFDPRPDTQIDRDLQRVVSEDIERTQKAISDGCEMFSVEESYERLREKYGF